MLPAYNAAVAMFHTYLKWHKQKDIYCKWSMCMENSKMEILKKDNKLNIFIVAFWFSFAILDSIHQWFWIIEVKLRPGT